MFVAAAALSAFGVAWAATLGATPPASAAGPQVDYRVSRGPPALSVTSLLSLEFGSLGSPAAHGHGEAIVARYHIEDPALIVASMVAKDLATRLGAAPAQLEGQQNPRDFDASQDRYLVAVQTESWGFDFFTLDPGHYRAVYAATLSIRDNLTHKVIGRGWGRVYGSDPTGAPTGKELLANDAGRLKALLAEQAAACVAPIEKLAFRAL
jgi:hypothetical protein